MDITQDIQALTTFRNNSSAFLQQLKKTKRRVSLHRQGTSLRNACGRFRKLPKDRSLRLDDCRLRGHPRCRPNIKVSVRPLPSRG
jgi:hypothetical protein